MLRYRKRNLKPYFEAFKTNYYNNRLDKVYSGVFAEEFIKKQTLKRTVKAWKYFTFSKGNQFFEERVKEDVEA